MISSHAQPTPNPLSDSRCDGASRVLLMRHGQTEANSRGFFLGRRDEGVTELGAEQSARAIEGLVDWSPDRIVCSPLKRCKSLIAEPAARELDVDLTVDDRLVEFDFGPIEGLTFDDVIERDLPFPWGPRALRWPGDSGGEPFEEFMERIGEACRDLELFDGRTAVVVHGGIIRGIFGHWLGMGVDDINHLIVRNVDSFVFRTREGFAELESYGIHPDDLANY